MTTRTHGGLVERSIEAALNWLRLAATSRTSAAITSEHGRYPAVAAEFHKAAAERYMEAARQAERLAEGCRIQAEYHRSMAGIGLGEATSAEDGR